MAYIATEGALDTLKDWGSAISDGLNSALGKENREYLQQQATQRAQASLAQKVGGFLNSIFGPPAPTQQTFAGATPMTWAAGIGVVGLGLYLVLRRGK